jgi:sugar phosphate isomerase/epimerase/dTDP-4-dehydrorhamnose reductase
MKTALIGYTGFVGSNLAKQYKFTDLYNSKNIDKIKNKSYDLIVSAGTSALRWKANQEPKEDWKGIKKLLGTLKKVKTKHFVLISTIDVYPQKIGVNEDTKIKLKDLTEAYGRNRYKMELIVKKHFPKVTIIRYPQLYGTDLKKNFIFDLINDNALDFTHKDTLLQLYHLKNIWKDIQTAIKNNINLINFATEPLTAKDIAKYTLRMDFKTITEKPPLAFDIRTKHGKIYGSKDEYIYHKKETLSDLKKFITLERKIALKPKLAISNLAWEEKQNEKVLPILKKYKIVKIEVAPSKISNLEAFRDFWQKNCIEIIATTSLLFGHPELTIFENELIRQKTLVYLKKMIKTSSLLGAKTMIFGSPKNRNIGNLSKKEALEIAKDFFGKIAEKCKRYNINFAFEPNPPIYGTDFINTTKEAIELTKIVNHPNFGINIDMSTMTKNKENYEETIKNALPYAKHFHLSEPGLKVIPQKLSNHKKLAKALKKTKYNGILSIEMPLQDTKTNLQQIKKTLKFIASTYN